MTVGYSLSPLAQSDLDDIWEYTERNWGIEQAEAYARQIWQRIEAIAANPALRKSCPEVRAGYFKLPAGSHIVFYRLAGGEIDVVRILHERMDFGRRLSTV